LRLTQRLGKIAILGQPPRKARGNCTMSEFQKRFGFIAVEKGFITTDQLVEALRVQVKEEVERGKHTLIGAILFNQGYISLPQIEEVLETMNTLCAF